jgi:hypothetical protein
MRTSIPILCAWPCMEHLYRDDSWEGHEFFTGEGWYRATWTSQTRAKNQDQPCMRHASNLGVTVRDRLATAYGIRTQIAALRGEIVGLYLDGLA